MRLKPKTAAFLAFTAFFAVLASFVFWGTWSLSVAPVMPDHPVSYPLNYVETWIRGWLTSGKFVPGDAIIFLGSPYFWLELKYVLALYCAALGMVYFLRGRGLSPFASDGAGLFLAFSCYWCAFFSAGHFGWFQWMTYGVFVFGLIDRALEKNKLRHWLLLGAVLAWGSFYQPDLWLLFAVSQFVYFVFRLARVAVEILKSRNNEITASRNPDISKFRLSILVNPLLAFVVFLLIGFPSFYHAIAKDLAGRDAQIARGETLGGAASSRANSEDPASSRATLEEKPTQDASTQNAEREKRWIFTTNWSMPPEATLEFFLEGREGDTSCPMTLAIGNARRNGIREYTGRLGRPLGAPAGNYRQHSLYVGWLTCLLALVGVASLFMGGAKSTIVFFAISALLFWLISMGRFCEPVYRVIFALPMGDYLRAPVKWHHLTEFSLVVLAGFGLEFVYNLARSKFRNVALSKLLLIALIAWGSIDLAVSARPFCAPRTADANLQFIQATAQQLQHPQARAQLQQMGLKPIGFLPQRGLAIVEKRHVRRTTKLDTTFKPDTTVLLTAILSLLTTCGVLIFALFSMLYSKHRNFVISK